LNPSTNAPAFEVQGMYPQWQWCLLNSHQRLAAGQLGCWSLASGIQLIHFLLFLILREHQHLLQDSKRLQSKRSTQMLTYWPWVSSSLTHSNWPIVFSYFSLQLAPRRRLTLFSSHPRRLRR
jgi:hypothetical protein